LEDDDRTPADRLAVELRRHREEAGVSGAELARRTGYSQPTVSRFERGVGPPPGMLAVGRIAWHLGLSTGPRRDLIRLAREVAGHRASMVPIRVVLQSGVESVQRRIRLRERNVRHLRVYHPTIVPGLLQTEAYVRLVAQAGGLDDAQTGHLVEERLRRQRDSATRRCTILLPEGCVMQGVPDTVTMAEQCLAIAQTAAGHPCWTVGVIPRLIPVGSPANITMNAFDIYDDREVFLGTTAGNALVSDPFTVADHLRRFAGLERLALFGEQARDLLADIAADYGRHRPA
jgi:transcriptional regulator with XRE-family HTH domain